MAYSHDYYHDDPIELESPNGKQKKSSFFALIALLVSGGFFLQTTLASNISLGSASPVEFGQGTLQATACSGLTNLEMTPTASFTNAAGSGGFKFSSVTVSNIPAGCHGSDFTINAYENSSNTPLALFNSASTSAVIYDNAGTFETGAGITGMTVASSPGTFTATFAAPVAFSSSISKITLQSGAHAPAVSAIVYTVGQTGPGGGTIFYVAATPFACGPTRATTCTYLEAAPSGWNTGADPQHSWAQSTPVNYQSAAVGSSGSPETATATAIGWGFRNTRATILQGNTNTSSSAAALADSHTVTVSGVIYDDWYLPSKDELNQMCKWQRGVAWTSDATVCSGGTLNSGVGAAGFVSAFYWSSSEDVADVAWGQAFGSGVQDYDFKGYTNYVRPVRAF